MGVDRWLDGREGMGWDGSMWDELGVLSSVPSGLGRGLDRDFGRLCGHLLFDGSDFLY